MGSKYFPGLKKSPHFSIISCNPTDANRLCASGVKFLPYLENTLLAAIEYTSTVLHSVPLKSKITWEIGFETNIFTYFYFLVGVLQENIEVKCNDKLRV